MKSYPSLLIPIEKLINYRYAYGRSLQKKGINNYHLPLGMVIDPKDQEFTFYKRNEALLEISPILKVNSSGVEFVSKTRLSPGWIETTKKLAETSRRKREVQKKLNERIDRSKLSKMSVSESLGNTGSNLDKFEKPTREKRFRVQKFIQKNKLAHNNVCTCGSPIGDFIQFKKNNIHKNVSVSGVSTCGSVWACPVCRAKIVNQRSKELNEIYEKGSKKGYEFHLITLTVPHERKDNLAELYGSSSLRVGLSGALTKFRQSRVWSKEFKPFIEHIGDIRAIEITYGLNSGFHPHVHMVVLSKKKFPEKYWTDKLLKQWQKNCVSSGLKKPNERGIKIDYVQSSEMVTYLSKWSVGSELQSDSAKESKGKNFSIAELELMLIDEKARGMNALSLETISGILKAYYSATKGQKQLVYGGLRNDWKKDLLESEFTDEEISMTDLIDEKEDHIFIIRKSLYKKLKKSGILSELIEATELISLETPNYKKIVYHKAKEVLFRNGISDIYLYSEDEFNRIYNKEIEIKQGGRTIFKSGNTID